MYTSMSNRMCLYVIVCLSLVMTTVSAEQTNGPLTVHPGNPRYFADASGKAVYVTGSHNWNNFQDMGWTDPPAAINYSGHLEWLVGYGHNFTRGWNWEQARWVPWVTSNVYINPLPFARTGPGTALDGKPKFNLNQFNQSYFDRLRNRVIEAGNHGIYMGIMLFEGWSVEKPFASTPGNPWPGHPMNASNNINGINGNPNTSDGLDGIEIHTLQVSAITNIQKAYIRKVIDTLNDLDNIIWEIGNEIHESSVPWQYHMIDYIHSYEATKPQQHLVWMTAAPPTNPQVDASNAEVVSYTRTGLETLKTDPPATSGSKVVLLDTDHLWGTGGDQDWVWKSFTRGYHPIYMDPILDLPGYGGLDPASPSHERCRKAMGYTLSYANRMNLANVIPQPSSSSTPSSTKYCLYNSGVEYLIYQAGSGAFTVNLPAGAYDYEWFNPDTGTVVLQDMLTWGGGNRSFTPPFSGDAVLFISDLGLNPTLITDSFANNSPDRDAGDPLNGTLTETGNERWVATASAVFSNGGYITNTNASTPAGSVEFDPSAYGGDVVMAEAEVNSADGLGDNWLSIGFMSGTGSVWADGEVWMLVRRDGQYTVFADRTNHNLADSAVIVNEDDLKRASILYNPSQNTVSAWINGIPILTDYDLDGLSFTPSITRAGFTTHCVDGFPADSIAIDNFAVKVGINEPPSFPGDFDRDGDVDQQDFGHFQACMTGNGEAQNNPACAGTLFDDDEDVDTSDFSIFMGCMSGPNTPSDADCTN